VLVIGSGFTTHGLTRDNFLGKTTPGWSRDFDAWAAAALAEGDIDELANYRTRAPGMPYAHPTVEHFVPLFVTLGAAADPEAARDFTIDGFWRDCPRDRFRWPEAPCRSRARGGCRGRSRRRS
jgi:4,5-DOPA dioxygenase extradiol